MRPIGDIFFCCVLTSCFVLVWHALPDGTPDAPNVLQALKEVAVAAVVEVVSPNSVGCMTSYSQVAALSRESCTGDAWGRMVEGFISRGELLDPVDSASTTTTTTTTIPYRRPRIELVVTRNSSPAGISLVLFSDHTFLAASGETYQLSSAEYAKLYTLAQDFTRLPADTETNTDTDTDTYTDRDVNKDADASRFGFRSHKFFSSWKSGLGGLGVDFRGAGVPVKSPGNGNMSAEEERMLSANP